MQRYVVSDWMLDEWADEEFKVISRASSGEGEESDERSEDETAPKTWGEMSDAEKGALLLAKHEGKVIENWHWGRECWIDDLYELWGSGVAYRIRPEPPAEPKRETVTLLVDEGGSTHSSFDPHESFSWKAVAKITYDKVDGKPDCASIKMEEV